MNHLFNTGGDYSLRIKDNRFNNILTANDILLDRINKLSKTKDVKLSDIRQTHMFFERGHYIPFINTISDYSIVKSNGGSLNISNAEQKLKFTLPINGNFTSDIAIQVNIPTIDSFQLTGDRTVYFKFCNYLGIRLIKEVKFLSSEFVIDQYNSDEVLLTKNFNNSERYDILVGQQQQKDATINLYNKTQIIKYADGIQTPKKLHKSFEMLIPIMFDFCKEPERAIHNSFIINTQRTIEITLNTINNIIRAFVIDNGIESKPITITADNIPLDIKLLVNNLYIPIEIDDIVSKNMTHILYRMRQYQSIQLSNKSKINKVKLGQFKYVAENILIGCRESNLPFDYWNLFGTLNCDEILIPSLYPMFTQNLVNIVVNNSVKLTTLDPILESLKITSNNIDIIKKQSSLFYNMYLPNKYNKNLMTHSKDNSCYLIDYALNSGSHQPSGFYNFSMLGPETFIELTIEDQYINTNRQFELIVSMNALNFLVKDGDNLKLQYFS